MGIQCAQPGLKILNNPDNFTDISAPLTGEEVSELLKLKDAGKSNYIPSERDLRVYKKWVEVNNLFNEYAQPHEDSKLRDIISIAIILLIIAAVIYLLKTRNTSNVSYNFFSLWWKSTLIFLVVGALIGFLSGGNYGLGKAIGGGLIIAPLAGIFYGCLIWLFKR
jgi:hypothetical protein